MRINVRNILENIVLAASTLIILLFIWTVFIRGIFIGTPIEFRSWGDSFSSNGHKEQITHLTLANTYLPNRYVTAKVDCIKKIKEVGYVEWNLYDDKNNLIKSYPERAMIFQDKGTNMLDVPIERLPGASDLPPGRYRFHGYIKFDVGIQVYYIHVNTNYFDVLNPKFPNPCKEPTK